MFRSNNKIHLSYKTQFFSMLMSFIIIFLCLISYTKLSIDSMEYDSLRVNVAERQRTLVEKIILEGIYLRGHEKRDIEKDKKLFINSLKALRDGGYTSLPGKEDLEKYFLPAPSAKLIDRLNKQELLFNKLVQLIDSYESSSNKLKVEKEIMGLEKELYSISNLVILMFEVNSTDRFKTLIKVIFLLGLFLSIVLALLVKKVVELQEKEEANKKIQLYQNILDLAAKSSKIGTWTWDPNTDYIRSNDQLGPIFGLEPDGFPSKVEEFIDLLHPDDKERVRAAVQKTIDEGCEYEIEYRSIWKDGSIHNIYAKGQINYDKEGSPEKLAGICIDITNLKETERKLQEQSDELTAYAKRLEKSNAELEQFAYIASHDLQEPLRKVKFFGNRLKKNHSDKLEGSAVEYVDFMVDAASRMNDLIKDLLDLSRVNTRGNNFKKVDLNKAVSVVLSDLELEIENTNAQIDCEDLPEVKADSRQMEQLFQNLISNSIKYRKDNVRPRVKISSESKNDCINIYIKDNGIGMKDKFYGEVFKPFRRLHPKGKYDGTGIGLAICEKIVQRHKGSISVQSIEGEGSTFRVELPNL